MLHAIPELLNAEYVDVEVMSALIEVAVEDMPEVVLSLLEGVTESVGADGLGIGNTVESVLIGQLSDGVERSEQSVLLSAVGGIRAGGEGCVSLSAVGGSACSLAVNDV